MASIPQPTNTEWLAKIREEILEPDLPIIDAHHHLWDFPDNRYLLDEFLQDTGTLKGDGHNIVATVFAEVREMYRAEGPEHLKSVGETEFVNGIAAQSASGRFGPTRIAAAMFGNADLRQGEAVGETLDAHITHAPERFRGTRYITYWDDTDPFSGPFTGSPKGLLLDTTFQRGAKELTKRNLSFDAFFFHHQIPDLTAMARALPDLKIVLNHFGGPLGVGAYKGKREQIFAQWKKDMAELASCENVCAKLGGLCMMTSGYDFEKKPLPPTSDELVTLQKDWYFHTIDVFGPKRCMFESNFPVDKYGVSYHVLWNFFKKLTKNFSTSERAALFHDTASRFYRIETI